VSLEAPELAELPPGPRQPQYAQALQWLARPLPFMLRQRERFGDVFTFDFIAGFPLVVLADPEDVKTVFTGPPEVMHAGEANAVLGPILGENSVLLLDEGRHLRQRRLLLPPFHGDRMRRYAEIMDEAVEREVATWTEGESMPLIDRMQAITLEVIMRAVFGVESGAGMEGLRRLLVNMLEMTTDPGRLVSGLFFGIDSDRVVNSRRAALDPVDEELYRIIAARREDPGLEEREDILSMLLLARDGNGEPMNDVELRDELMTLLIAGHETTASTLAWAFERLVHEPEKLERLVAEVRGGGEDAYTEAVIQETLRLRPVIPMVARVITRPITVGQGRFRLPAGTRVAPSILLVHMREEIYPEPFEFRPERFLESPPGTYTWIPFGGGMRRCIGAAFAQFEMRAVLRGVLRSVDLAPAGGAERISRRAITLVPRRGGRVTVERVLPAAGRAGERPAVAA